MIIVSGANGKLGRLVVNRLLDLGVERVGVCVRDPARAQDLADRGVRVRHGDFTDGTTLEHAFEGASRVLVVSVDRLGPVAVEMHRTAVNAAAKAGTERIVYTSHMGADPSSPFAPAVDHADAEAALRDSGVPFTALRNGFYASSLRMLIAGAAHTGEVATPADGPVAWTGHEDLAEAAVVALTGDQLTGVTPALTGAEAVDLAEVADLMGVRRVVVTDDEYVAGLVANGVPEHVAPMMLGMFAASRRGDFAPADPTLARLLGRPPASVRDLISEVLT